MEEIVQLFSEGDANHPVCVSTLLPPAFKLQHIHVSYALISPRVSISYLCKRKGWSLQRLTQPYNCRAFSVPSRTWTSTMVQATNQASGCQTRCRPQFCFRRCIFLQSTTQLTGYRILACHIQHTGFLWLSDNNQLETQDVLKAQIAASQQMGLC